MSAKPTPTPWKATKCTNGDIYIGGHEWAAKLVDKVDFTTMPKEANAAFIVRAVNSHEALLKACKAILTNNVIVLFPEDEKLVREAIAKAEAL